MTALLCLLIGLGAAVLALVVARQHMATADRYRTACAVLGTTLDHHPSVRLAAAWIHAAGEDREISSVMELEHAVQAARADEAAAPLPRCVTTRRAIPTPMPHRRRTDRQSGCFHLSVLQNVALVALIPLAMFAAQQLDPGPTAARAEQDVQDEALAVQAYAAEPADPVENAVVAGLQPLALSTAR